ncbi:MAG: hypothetical protein GY765_33120 [bacterium]|nr:hypothetical protein [bacterium]
MQVSDLGQHPMPNGQMKPPDGEHKPPPPGEGHHPLKALVDTLPEDQKSAIKEILDNLSEEEKTALKEKLDELKPKSQSMSKDEIGTAFLGILEEITGDSNIITEDNVDAYV